MRCSFAATMAVVLITPIAVPAGAQRSTKIQSPPAGVTVPMKDFGGRPVVDVTIDGKPHTMILDTGASRTVLDPALFGGQTGPGVVKELGIGALKLIDFSVGRQPLLKLPNPPADLPVGVLSASEFP